jgi:hypothetical protein
MAGDIDEARAVHGPQKGDAKLLLRIRLQLPHAAPV